MSRCLLTEEHVHFPHDVRAGGPSLHVQDGIAVFHLAEGPASVLVEGGQARCLGNDRSALWIAFMDSKG